VDRATGRRARFPESSVPSRCEACLTRFEHYPSVAAVGWVGLESCRMFLLSRSTFRTLKRL
jgi:hypothetical protein